MTNSSTEKIDKKVALKQKNLLRKKKAKQQIENVQLGEDNTEQKQKKNQVQKQNQKVVEKQQQKQQKQGKAEDKNDDVPADMVGDVTFRRTKTEKRMTNIQKMLVIGSRSIGHKDRHLLQDLCGIMAHGRPHPKLDVRQDIGTSLQELCNLHNCNGSVFLEARKFDVSYLWFAQAPQGPSMKFQLFNVHTADELRMVGNSLKYSRPLLHFDAEFDQIPHLRIARALLTSAFNIPRYHSRSKPFVDHILCFFVLEGKIYFRHYQIQEQANGQFGLTEIGPRFVLDPQVLLEGCVQGKVVWKSDSAIAPSALRKSRRERVLEKLKFNEKQEHQQEKHRKSLPEKGPDPLEGTFRRQ